MEQLGAESGTEDVYEEPTDRRVRLDPLDARTSRHAAQCEFASETQAAVIRVVLKIQVGADGTYWWVTCGACTSVGRFRTTPRASGEGQDWPPRPGRYSL